MDPTRVRRNVERPLPSPAQHETIDWQGDDDPQNPSNWNLQKKWLVTLTACTGTFLVGLNATGYTGAGLAIAEHFNIKSDTSFDHSFWPVTAWNAGATIVPMVLLPVGEAFGIRPVYLTSYLLFTLFVVPQAVAPNFATMVVCRFIAGSFGGTLQNIIDSGIADIWRDPRERDLPVTLFVFALVFGVTFGPVFGGLIAESLHWRWYGTLPNSYATSLKPARIFYIQLIIYGAFSPLVYFFMPETRGPVILTHRAKALQKKADNTLVITSSETPPPISVARILQAAVIRPAHLLTTEPVIFFFTLWSAFAFGLVFISTQSIALVYSTTYGFTEPQTGLVQTSVCVGELIGCLACIPQNAYYLRSAGRNRQTPGKPLPEARLLLSVPASVFGLAAGLFWYGWTSRSSIPWIVPTVGLGFTGFGIMIIIHAVGMYITDSYARYAASAIAGIAFGENLFAAVLPLAAGAMYGRLGFAWASSLLGFVALALSCAPVVLLFKGESIRSRSKFMKEASYDG
ncbi:hypothetical protein LTR56_024104 [Elasticomyces elasticus]|nr:hypothetical protein LTR22_028157 [Elasticomyces elasticus]KAK3619331.1 hypothetical protein LTR56_024104 [Elasticomyces elasticus]KAK4906004.1 hypothetical protein LTR49_024784 [Elasticomyces elasticus]KAK5734882.1 hypothetical protein LTS12_026604 [Elasticomyces elasticus]